MAFVTLLYRNILGRDPDSGGLQFWTNLLNTNQLTRAAVADSFVRSQEFNSSIPPRAYANLLYMGFLRRTADPAGLAFWTGVLANPAALSDAINTFITSPEYINRLLQIPP